MNHDSKTSINLRGFTQIIWIVTNRNVIRIKASYECIRCQRTILAHFQHHYPPCIRNAANRCPNHLLSINSYLIAGEVSNKLWSLWLSGFFPQSVLCFWLKFNEVYSKQLISLSLTSSALLLHHHDDHQLPSTFPKRSGAPGEAQGATLGPWWKGVVLWPIKAWETIGLGRKVPPKIQKIMSYMTCFGGLQAKSVIFFGSLEDDFGVEVRILESCKRQALKRESDENHIFWWSFWEV